MSLSRRASFFRIRAGNSDANAQPIIDGLRVLGHFVVSIRASDPGAPDLVVYRRFRSGAYAIAPVWLELKTRTGRLRQAQVDWRGIAQQRGIPVHVVRSLDEALEALHAETKGIAP